MTADKSLESWHWPWTGSCRCGRVTLRITKPPLLTGVCHCTGCQKMSASAFSLSIAVPGDVFAGLLAAFAREGTRPRK